MSHGLFWNTEYEEFIVRTADDIETFMLESGYGFERLKDHIWRISDERNGIEEIAVFITEHVLNIQLRLFRLPPSPSIQLLRRLLELNATSVIHGAFGIEGDHVVLIGALEIENLDRNELQSMVDSIALAAGENYDELKALLG